MLHIALHRPEIHKMDHGEEFWDHGKFEHGHSLMGILTHIPLIVYGPSFKGRGKVRTLVEHVDLYQGILSLAGAQAPSDTMGENVFALLESEDAERWSISENTLYGGPQVSIMSPRHRLVLNQTDNIATVWELDEEGMDKQVAPEEKQYEIAMPMLSVLGKARGHLKPIDNVSGPSLPNQGVFQQLKELGYLDKRE